MKSITVPKPTSRLRRRARDEVCAQIARTAESDAPDLSARRRKYAEHLQAWGFWRHHPDAAVGG